MQHNSVPPRCKYGRQPGNSGTSSELDLDPAAKQLQYLKISKNEADYKIKMLKEISIILVVIVHYIIEVESMRLISAKFEV